MKQTLDSRVNRVEGLLQAKAKSGRKPIHLSPCEEKIYRLLIDLIIKLHLRKLREQREGDKTKKPIGSLSLEFHPLLLDILNTFSDEEKDKADPIRINKAFQEAIGRSEKICDSEKAFFLEKLQENSKPFSEIYEEGSKKE